MTSWVKARGVVVALALSWPGESSAQSPTAEVFLNHFFVVVDAETYRAMQASAFLTGAFAPYEKRTTARNDQTYTGIYWYGRRTYFEAFEPDSQGPVGSSGIAWSVDQAGGSLAVKAAWTKAFGGAQSAPVTRKTETAEPVWFQMTFAHAQSGLRMWLMEYDADFLARWYPDLTKARGITRAEVLDRYAAKIGRGADRETAVLGDVTGLVLGLAAADRETLRQHLVPVGWTASDDGPSLLLRGPEGVVLRVEAAAEGRRGILEATFSVQGRPTPRQESLGAAALTVETDRARLRFVR